MTPKDKKKALALVDRIKKAEGLSHRGLLRQLQNKPWTRASDQGREQESRNAIKAEQAYAELQKLIEEQ